MSLRRPEWTRIPGPPSATWAVQVHGMSRGMDLLRSLHLPWQAGQSIRAILRESWESSESLKAGGNLYEAANIYRAKKQNRVLRPSSPSEASPIITGKEGSGTEEAAPSCAVIAASGPAIMSLRIAPCELNALSISV